MKTVQTHSRSSYVTTQIERSRRKFGYCKVSARDPRKYIRIIRSFCNTHALPCANGPVLCLGTRNGREVDLFRNAMFHPIINSCIECTEMKVRGFSSPLDFMGARTRSTHTNISDTSVIGVEVNPDAKREDVWIGSFDDMPEEWNGLFFIVYSNSFDQSYDPYRTATEWVRVTQPGGFLIIAFDTQKQPSTTDPVGGLSVEDIKKLFEGETVYYTPRGSVYSEIIIRKPTH